eukprot:s535_g14.t1
MSEFLEGPLWLPFLEPAVLRHGLPTDDSCAPNFGHESRSECLKLLKLWDAKGLLELFAEPVGEGMFCRCFNAFKDSQKDRQIGDRRKVNMSELSYDGPSRFLPPGPLLVQLKVARFRERLVASVTDRRDFYHQARVSLERYHTNLLPFRYSRAELQGLKGLESFDQRHQEPSKAKREIVGDRLGVDLKTQATHDDSQQLYPGFRSLFQGDHLGVEFALCSHQVLLERHGLLVEEQQVKGHRGFPAGPVYSGLFIDDFFLIGRERLHEPPLHTAASRALAKARQVYASEGLLGSEEKDVVAESRFKAAGAEVISDVAAVSSGLTTVGAPVMKRLALAALSMRVAALPGVTPNLVSRLAGNWTSVLMYRRCLCAVVDGLFALGTRALDFSPETIMPLPRAICTELVVLATLAPVMCSNVAVEYLQKAYATDASLAKGAIVQAPVNSEVCESLWLDSDKKGNYVMLENGFREVLKHVGECGVEEEAVPELVRPKASPLMYYDFVEVCGGVGAVTTAAAALGLVCAPPLDLSASRHYDLTDLRLLEMDFAHDCSGSFPFILA